MNTKLATYFTIDRMLGFNMLLHVLLGLANLITIRTMKLTSAYFYISFSLMAIAIITVLH